MSHHNPSITLHHPSTISQRLTAPAVTVSVLTYRADGSRPNASAMIAARVESPFENGGRSSSCSNAPKPDTSSSTPPNDWIYALVARSSLRRREWERRVSFLRILRSSKFISSKRRSRPRFDVVVVVESRCDDARVSWRAVELSGPRLWLCWGLSWWRESLRWPWWTADHF